MRKTGLLLPERLHAGLGAQPGSMPAGDAPPPQRFSLKSRVRAVHAGAERRTGQPAASLSLLEARAVQWPSGAPGCPGTEVRYAAQPVPGYRIRLAAPGQALDDHASTRGQCLLCPPGREVDPVPSNQR